MKDAIGIDLGTTNTVLARGERVLPIRSDEGAPRSSLASAVAFTPSGAVLVGATAKRRRAIDPENTIVSSKRLIGRGGSAVALEEFRRRYPTKLALSPEGPMFVTRRGQISPTQVAALVLASAMQGADVDPGSTSAVITVPASFSEAQRAATREAGERAGLSSVRLLEEPVATAVAHGALAQVRYAAVYDIGGGTFDFAVLEKKDGAVRVLGHGGDLFLGGDDLDHALAQHVARELVRQHGWDLTHDVLAMDRLVGECEQAKMRLTWEESTTIDLGQVDPDTPVDGAVLAVSRADLARACNDLVRRTFITCDEVMAQVGLPPRSMEAVYLAGGTTLVPFVRAAVASYFGVAPSEAISPVDVVARGASLAAEA